MTVTGSLVRRVAFALHEDSDHGRDGAEFDWTGAKRRVCDCLYKARIACSVFAENRTHVR